MKSLKIVLVGDGMVGKTCLLVSYVDKKFPEDYLPTVFDNKTVNIAIDEEEHQVTLWDTAGHEEMENMRSVSYPNTSCFIVCFSMNNRISLNNIVSKWYPELREYSPRSPIVLVGTKSDVYVENSPNCVQHSDIKSIEKKIKASSFIECSALKMENVDLVFEEAVRATTKSQKSGMLRSLSNLLSFN